MQSLCKVPNVPGDKVNNDFNVKAFTLIGLDIANAMGLLMVMKCTTLLAKLNYR